MKLSFALAALATTLLSSAYAGPKVIYGVDDRREVFEATAEQQKWARSTATLIHKNAMMSVPEMGLVFLSQTTLKEWLEAVVREQAKEEEEDKTFSKEIERVVLSGGGFCAETRFTNQPNPASCSGFLIAPDLIATAGHCVQEEGFCADNKWVFDFKVDKLSKTAGLDILEENVYGCKRVVTSALEMVFGLDYAVVQLDRKVKGREPLELNLQRKVDEATELVVIGSPSGLPTKVTPGGKVRDNTNPNFFVTTLDTFQGNSGSAVFNSQTGVVEGILVRGEEDFEIDFLKMCVKEKFCAENGCRGEDVSRITSVPELAFLPFIQNAAEGGHVEELHTYIKFYSWVDFYGADGQSALIKAAAAGRAETLNYLIKAGADVNLKDQIGNTALHEVSKAKTTKVAEVIEALVLAGAKLEEKNEAGDTPLLAAARNSNIEAAKTLMALGANQKALDANGNDIVRVFAEVGDTKGLSVLYEMGFDTRSLIQIRWADPAQE